MKALSARAKSDEPPTLWLLVLPLLLAACGLPGQQQGQIQGRAVQVKRDRIEATITPTGAVTPAVQSKLNFRISGVFTAYKVIVGDHVKAGQELAALDAPDQDSAVAKAEFDLASAQASAKTAQAKLETIQNGPRPENVEQARTALVGAQAKLASLMAGGRAEDVTSKQAALDSAKARLDQLQHGPRAEDVAQAQATLDQAQAKLQALQNGPRPEQIAIYRTQIEQAKNSLLSAQLSRDFACSRGGSSCDSANASVNAAQNGVDLANQQLASNTAPPTATDLSQAQAAVTSAQQALKKAQAPYTDQDLQQQKDAVAQAQQAVALSQKPSTQQDVDQAIASVDSAMAAYALAQKPYTPQDLTQAQAALEQAQATVRQNQQTLETAKLNQSYKSLRAPYDGTILAETANPGEAIGPSGAQTTAVQTSTGNASSSGGNAAILMSSDDGMQINASVDETDIGKVQIGQRVDITFDAFPDKKFTGHVKFVPAQGATVQNIQQYVVNISLDTDANLPKPGMTANCAIVVSSKDNALVLPNAAIQNVSGKSVVLLKTDAAPQPVQQPVQTGLTSVNATEITAGLSEGDTVIIGRIPSAGGFGFGGGGGAGK